MAVTGSTTNQRPATRWQKGEKDMAWDRVIRAGGVVLALAIALVATTFTANAQVKPGDFITPDNASKVKDLLPPGTYMRVEHGMT